MVDGGDGEVLAGDDLCRTVRGEGHNAVPDGVPASAGGDEVFAVEVAEVVVAGAGEPVEISDVFAPPGQQRGAMPGVDVISPLVDHLREGLGASGGDGGASGPGVPGDTVRHGPVAEVVEGGPFGGVGLADVLIEGGDDAGASFEEGVDGTAGTDGGELTLVADEHELRAGPLDPDGKAEQVGIGGHGGLVEDHHGALVEDVVMVVEPPQQRPQRP